MTAFDIQVESYAGYRADQEPRRFQLGGRWLAVEEIVDRWYDPECRYFKLRADDGGIYILRHDDRHGWELYMFDSGTREGLKLSST